MQRAITFICTLLLCLAGAGTASAACTIQPIDFGESRNGTIAADDCQNATSNSIFYYDSYTFEGVAGQKIAVTMNTASGLDPFLFLLNPDRTFISDNNSGGGVNARIPATGFLTLTQTGTHEIQAVTAVPLTTGAYTLALSSSTPASCHVAADPQSSATLPLARGTAVTISAVCGSGTAPMTFTWSGGVGGVFTGASRTVTLTQTTTYSIVASNANGTSPPFSITVFVAAPLPGVPTIEFYNVDLAHYFVTAVQAEASAIDNGSAGPGWVRTGFSYDVYSNPVSAGGINTVPVCRFYGTPGRGPNSHFYTADAAECEQVKRDPGWTYEGIAYHIQAWTGSCPNGTQSVYRAYNNRAAQNDSNHRFITNNTTFRQMGEQGWNLEGIVMCTAASRAPVPLTGGTFKDPTGAATVSVGQGQIPASANATAPSMRGTGALPPAMITPGIGDTNVTSGAAGYTFDLTGDTGFTTKTPGAVTVSLPFNANSIPSADLTPVKVRLRLFDPQVGSPLDLSGTLAAAGGNGTLTVETRGLPRRFIGSVIYNANMDAVTSDQSAPAATSPAIKAVGETTATQATIWPAQAWCIIYNPSSPSLIAAVKSVLGVAGTPTMAQMRSVLIDKVGLGARRAQTVFQNDGHVAPNLVVKTTCGGTTPRYDIHMEEEGSGLFIPDDPGEPVSARNNHYGRLYADNARLDDATSTMLGSILASIAHEMHHASQSAQGLITLTTKGYVESAAALYGKTIDNNGSVRGRPGEVQILTTALMEPNESSQYDNQDFLAYVTKVYAGGNLAWLSGFYAQLQAAIAGSDEPEPPVGYGAMDAYFKSAFGGQSLNGIYLDFVRQRALTHNAASQMGHPNEVTSGFAANLFGSSVARHSIDVNACSSKKEPGGFTLVSPYSTRAIVITASGTVPTTSAGPTLNVKVIPDAGTVGGLWGGWTYRTNAASALAETNRFSGFGKQAGEQIVLLLSNLDPAASDHEVEYEITCGGVKIDSLSPARGKAGDVITINGSGFGAAGDTRTVTFNGLAAAVTWVSDTQLRATVPANASSGDVFVTVNGEKSNGAAFEIVATCSIQQNAGGDTPDTRSIELGKTMGSFNFTYNTYSQEDQIIVRYQGATLFDTGCVGATGTRTLNFSGTQTFISVQVVPNCKGGSGTAWDYSVSCP